MITTDKAYQIYSFDCDCGHEIKFASGQPSGEIEYFICPLCNKLNSGRIPANAPKYSYKAQAETTAIRRSIFDVFDEFKMSMTVRQVYYQAVTRGTIDKTEAGYNKIQQQLLQLRRQGLLPYSLIADNSRRFMKPKSYNSLESALNEWLQYYRVNLWKNKAVHVEIWLEKDALSGIFGDVTYDYDVPLYVARGFSSESFLYKASEDIKRIGKETFVYFFSDYDPSGITLSNKVRDQLPKFGVNINFERVALDEYQIDLWNLPTRPTKESTHSKNFEGESCELDAINPHQLKELVKGCVLRHLSQKDIEIIQSEEYVHRQSLKQVTTLLGMQ